MATIEINDQELRDNINELIAIEDDFLVDSKVVDEKIESFLIGLKESPEKILAEIIFDDIYFEVEDENGKYIEVEK
jgi:hypothetical protein